MEIVPAVHAIDTHRMGRCYLYQEADALTLIDTGYAGRSAAIFAAIESLGRRVEDVRQVIVTHWHVDHAGSVPDVVARSDAQVIAHPVDAAILRGERERPGPSGAWRILTPLLRLAPTTATMRVDREVNDGDEIDLGGGARILHTPGHTLGSISVYLPGRKLLFTGDAIANTLGLRTPIGIFTEDHAQARASIKRLAQLDFEVACFGHGKPLDKDASTLVRRLAEKL